MPAVAEGIVWKESLDEARERTARHGKPVLIDFSAAPACGGCVAMDAVTYPDARVSNFIQQDCVPVRVAAKDNPALVSEYLVGWTPNVVIADDRGRVHYRVEGFLPPEEFVARLSLGVGKFLLHGGRVAEAAALRRIPLY
jgi:thioredoxin-related protein